MKTKQFLPGVLLVVAFSMCGCQNAGLNRAAAISPKGEKCLGKEPFRGIETGGWQFSWELQKFGGIPDEAFVRLYARQGTNVVEILKPDMMGSLIGLRIKSKDQALSFVRVFTDDDTCMRFTGLCAVEYPRDSATVSETNGTYTITRQLLYLKEPPGFNLWTSIRTKFPVYEVKETVLQDGTYSCARLRAIAWIDESDLRLRYIE